MQHEVRTPEGFQPTCLAHPDTYLNKVVLGGGDGRLLLYNFVSGALLYTFQDVNSSAVQCIAGSPALDVVGIGFADGCDLSRYRSCPADLDSLQACALKRGMYFSRISQVLGTASWRPA